jgi:hypothetical protein
VFHFLYDVHHLQNKSDSSKRKKSRCSNERKKNSDKEKEKGEGKKGKMMEDAKDEYILLCLLHIAFLISIFVSFSSCC